MDNPYDTHELAWVAGFWDGEGCSRFRPSRYRLKDGTLSKSGSLSVQTMQTDPRPLDRLHDAVGVGTVTGPYHPSGTRQKDYWVWSATRTADVILFGNLVVPFMCAPKQEQYAEALGKWAACHPAIGDGTAPISGHGR